MNNCGKFHRALHIASSMEKWLIPVNQAARVAITGRVLAEYPQLETLGLSVEECLVAISRHQFTKNAVRDAVYKLPGAYRQHVVHAAQAVNCEFSWTTDQEDFKKTLQLDRVLWPFAYVFSFTYEATQWSGQQIVGKDKVLRGLVQVYYYYTLGYKACKQGLLPMMYPIRRMELSWDEASREILKMNSKEEIERMIQAHNLQAQRMRYPWYGFGNDNN